MAEDDALDSGERADGDRVEMVLYRDEDGFVAAVPHDVREEI